MWVIHRIIYMSLYKLVIINDGVLITCHSRLTGIKWGEIGWVGYVYNLLLNLWCMIHDHCVVKSWSHDHNAMTNTPTLPASSPGPPTLLWPYVTSLQHWLGNTTASEWRSPTKRRQPSLTFSWFWLYQILWMNHNLQVRIMYVYP